MDEINLQKLKKQFIDYFGFEDATLENLNVLVNDVFLVTTQDGKFALKLYNTLSRTLTDVQWELNLILQLLKKDAPVAKPVAGKNGYIQAFSLNGKDRVGVLFEWAPGEKPKPDLSTYILLGKAAAQIHQAADTFYSPIPREKHDIYELIDEQFERSKKHFIKANQWEKLVSLGERLKKHVDNQKLDRGICHMDLTLDNVHRDGDTLTVFDFDSAAECWRAIEPYGVLKSSKEKFDAWLEGYRSVREFSIANETAVFAFVIIGEIRNVTWKLGEAKSSRGKPLLTSTDLPLVVDEWLSWEDQNILNH